MIGQGLTNSFKLELLSGVHNLSSDVLKIALYTSSADIGSSTTAYTTVGEVVAAGYTAGGAVLSGVTISSLNGVAYVSFTNPSWSASITARGALVYNTSKSNKSVAVLNFGADKTSLLTFTITLPANTPDSALIRLS